MKVEQFSDLIDWTRAMHHRLAECLAQCSTQTEQELAKFLLSYLADHEAELEKAIDGFEKRADTKALNTWVYDYLDNQPINPDVTDEANFAKMSFDEICAKVFEIHNKVIDLYRHLLAQAEIPEARELLQSLLDLEEHETMRLAQQTNRMRDM